MKPSGILENWSISDNSKYGLLFEGHIFGYRGPAGLPDGRFFTMKVISEPPFFKSRIVQTNLDNFYRLGEPKG